jgi:hypothetical protein
VDDTFRQLLEGAKRRTDEGKLDWRAFNDETFHAMIGPGTLRIGRYYETRTDDAGGEYSETMYSMWVLDDKGRVVEEAELGPGLNYPFAEELFRAARKSALASNKVLEGMLSALSQG